MWELLGQFWEFFEQIGRNDGFAGISALVTLLIPLFTALMVAVAWIRRRIARRFAFPLFRRGRKRAQELLNRATRDMFFFLAYVLSEAIFHATLLAYGAGLLVYGWFLFRGTPPLTLQWGGMISTTVGLLAIWWAFWQLLAISEFAGKVLKGREQIPPNRP